jgi:hypothetical protein
MNLIFFRCFGYSIFGCFFITYCFSLLYGKSLKKQGTKLWRYKLYHMQEILKYFDEFSDKQLQQYSALAALYKG